MKKIYKLFGSVLVLAVFLLGGCATVQVAKDAKGTGFKKVYKKSVSEVWVAMQEAIAKTGGTVAQENKEECSILAEYGMGLFSWGERVGIFCTQLSPQETETEVVSKRAVSTNFTAPDWTGDIYEVLDSQLK